MPITPTLHIPHSLIAAGRIRMQDRTRWRRVKLSTLFFVIGIVVLTRFTYPNRVFSKVKAEAQQMSLPLISKQEQTNASLNIYMPLIMLNAGSLTPEQAVESPTTTVIRVFTSLTNSAQNNENVASLNIYAPLILQ